MKTTPDGLVGSIYELHGYGNRSLPIATTLWIVVAAWKGDGRGRRGRKRVWRIRLAPLESRGLCAFDALWNDRGKHVEAWDNNGNWLLSRRVG